MRALTFFCIMVTVCFLEAREVNWLGGVGQWHDPDHWDCNCVPMEGDTVYIAQDTVRIRSDSVAYADMVVISSSQADRTHLALLAGGALNLAMNIGVHRGLVLHGSSLLNFGSLTIASSDTGLIISDSNAIVRNHGYMHLEMRGAIFNYGTLINEVAGCIFIEEELSRSTTLAFVANYGEVINRGEISLNNTVLGGLISTGPLATIRNSGSLDIFNVGRAIELHDSSGFINSGSVQIDSCRTGLYGNSEVMTINSGQIIVSRAARAIDLYHGSTFLNSGLLSGSDLDDGIHTSDALSRNLTGGEIILNGGDDIGISVTSYEGRFENEYGGSIAISGFKTGIKLTISSQFINHAGASMGVFGSHDLAFQCFEGTQFLCDGTVELE